MLIAQFYLVQKTAFAHIQKSQVRQSHTFQNKPEVINYYNLSFLQQKLTIILSYTLAIFFYFLSPGPISFNLFLFLFKYNYQLIMKKVRISKKNPNRILRVIETSVSPHKQFNHLPKSIKNSLKIQQLKSHLDSKKLSHPQYTIQSHRYKPSTHLQQQKLRSSSPGEQLNWRTHERQIEDHKRPSKRYNGLRQIFHRSTDKSPYLHRKSQNKSQRKLVLSSKNILQQSYNANKQLKTIRFNSHQQKYQSLEIRKVSGSSDILKQAKKLMMAGQSRKSMFILKPLLNKEPQNLSALNVAAINLYNIGEFQRSAQHLDLILRLSPSFHQSVYILRAKIYFRHNKNIQQCLSKLEECSERFPNSEQPQVEKGQIYFSLHKYEKALMCFLAAERINPRSSSIQQKIISIYEVTENHQKILQKIKNIKKLTGNTQKFNEIKIKTLTKLGKYDQIIKQFNQNNDPQILYYYGLALLKQNDSLKAFLILQSSLPNSQDCTKSVQLMLLILCKGNEFYQAYHLKERCQFLNVNKDQLKRQFYFIEGVICLMKRNIEEGVNKINLACEEPGQSEDDQFLKYMTSVASMFLGYGYFSLGNYQKCKILYQNQLNNFPENKFQGISYNIELNLGFYYHQKQQLEKTIQIFEKLAQNYPDKIEPRFCLAISYVNLYFAERKMKKVENMELLKQSKQLFESSTTLVGKYHNNIAANFYYHKSVLHASLEQWRQAILNIDEAIQKSEQNYWRYYYLRAIILACIHNFSEAISDCSASINLKDTEPFPYLLRSCCFQIEGQGNCAFKDLQAYIALRPNDKTIHKYAGKLLFENGAFQDALAAFNHEQIPQSIENEDAFLTKCKTYFLLGRFAEAAEQMFKVNNINPDRKEAIFDAKMILIIQKLLKNEKYDQVISQISQMYADKTLTFTKCQIFKKTECHTLKSICYFYTQRYKQAISQLESAINAKQKIIMKQSLIEGSIREDEKDTRMYACQMNFNISICYLLMNDIPNAINYANRIIFNINDPFYEPHLVYLNILLGKTKNLLNKQDQPIKVQIFPSRNKISHYIQQVGIQTSNHTILTKLCIPFPKVEPPEIFPSFDEKLLRQFTIQRVERKSEAPWICKEENIIKFTSKMQKYSRLQIEQSATEMSSSERQIDNSHMSMQSIISRRSKKSPTKSYQNQFQRYENI